MKIIFLLYIEKKFFIATTLIQETIVPKLTFGPFLTLSVINGPSVSFGTNFPCNTSFITFVSTLFLVSMLLPLKEL